MEAANRLAVLAKSVAFVGLHQHRFGIEMRPGAERSVGFDLRKAVFNDPARCYASVTDRLDDIGRQHQPVPLRGVGAEQILRQPKGDTRELIK